MPLIRVDAEVYERILRQKHKLEQIRQERVSMNEAVRSLVLLRDHSKEKK